MDCKWTYQLVSPVISDVLEPRNFLLFTRRSVHCDHVPQEETPWKIFRGRLLEPRFTRQTRSFASWNVLLWENGSKEPLLSVKFDSARGELHVTRALYSYVWASGDAASNIIESRETKAWISELVGTIACANYDSADELRNELAQQVFLAIVGTSRLPLTSLEAPLPCFTVGELAYRCNPDGQTYLEQTKSLEFWLRWQSPHELVETVPRFIESWQKTGTEFLKVLRNVFNEASLSPYTSFVDTTLAFLKALVERRFLESTEEINFLSYLLRQTCRHLTAYDLHVFHYRGANYPDALVLHAVLTRYLERIEEDPSHFQGPDRVARIRRRALRQACLVRHSYRGLPVPNAPTSPGENARVLPPPYARVPEEQVLIRAKRTRRLFTDLISDLLGLRAREVLADSIVDLQQPQELRELGAAVFIDRPLGRGKLPGEPDETSLLAHEAFSTGIAKKRLDALGELAVALDLFGAPRKHSLPSPKLTEDLDLLGQLGLAIHKILPPDRPAVSLADASRVAEDFRIVRTLPGSVAEFLASFGFDDVKRRYDSSFLNSKKCLIVPVLSEITGQPALGIFDANYRKRLELTVNRELGFRIRGRNEYPVGGLTLTHVWDEAGSLIDAPGNCVLAPLPRSGFEEPGITLKSPILPTR